MKNNLPPIPDTLLREAGKLAISYSLCSSARAYLADMAASAKDPAKADFYKALAADTQDAEDRLQEAIYCLSNLLTE